MSAPSWLDHATPVVTQPGGQAPAQGTGTAAPHDPNRLPRGHEYIRWVVRIFTMGLAVMMAAAAVHGILRITEFALDEFFVAIYMMIFAAILFLFELSQFKYIGFVTRIFKRNFGFLYGGRGKALYIIFIAFLNFGLTHKGSNGSLELAAGILLAAEGGLMLLASLRYPRLFEGVVKEAPEPPQT